MAVRLPKLQFSTPLVIAHVPAPLYVGLMLQLIPVPVGRVSDRVAAAAVPVPMFCTVMEYPIDVPAETVAAVAVLVTLSAGHCTVILAEPCTVLAFEAPADAVLG